MMKQIAKYVMVYPDKIVEDDAMKRKALQWWNMLKRKATMLRPIIVKITYEIIDPDVVNQRKFFEGPVVEYYAVQNEGKPVGWRKLELYRELLLDEALGYDLLLPNGVVRRKRKSTREFKTTTAWHKFLERVKGLFEQAGYEFPDSDEFNELVKEYKEAGYSWEKAREKARETIIKKLYEKVGKNI